VQPHLALQQLCVEPLHQLLFCLTFLGLEAHEMQVDVALLLYGRISQGLHNSANHLVHVFGYHHSKVFFSPSDENLANKITSLYNNILNMGKNIIKRHAFDKF
jgi:hypothetical protein